MTTQSKDKAGSNPAVAPAKELKAAGRRGFLRSAGQAGVLAGAAAVGAVGSGSQAKLGSTGSTREDKGSYHETEHIRDYYRTSGIF